MKGSATTALRTLVIAVLIQSVSAAMELNVTVALVDIREYQGNIVTIKCAIRNVNLLNQEFYWIHKNVVSSGLTVARQYSNGRFEVSVFKLTLTNLDYYLTISDLMPGDTGDYRCVVVDIRTRRTLAAATATVSLHDHPKALSCSPEGSVSVMEGSLLGISCSSEKVTSPGNMTLTWIPPRNTLTSWDGPQDADWEVVNDSSGSVVKQLNLIVDNKFNDSKFVCATETEVDSYLVYGTCIIGLITVLAVPPGAMDVSVNIRQHQFPLRDGVISGFTCDIVFTPPVSATDYIQRHWQIPSEIDYNRTFHSGNPIQRNVYIGVLVQDSGSVLECAVTFRGKVYIGNITLHVTRESIPDTTLAYPTAATNSAYPTTATNSVPTRTLPPTSNLPWYTEPSSIAIISGAAVVLLLLTILMVVCLTCRRRRKLNRNTVQEAQLRSEQDTGYSPVYLNSRPLTMFSENIYNEASDPTTGPPDAFGGENIYHETVGPTVTSTFVGNNIYHEAVDPTDPLSTEGENVYQEAAEVVVLPLNESQEDVLISESEEVHFECGSPVPELELYAETVENILYVPLTEEVILEDGYSTVLETQLR